MRVDSSGEEGELLVRRKGEALDALQHLVNGIWRDQTGRDGRIVVDSQIGCADLLIVADIVRPA